MIILVGPFPPPIHGAALITERVAAQLSSDDVPVIRCDTSPQTSARGLRYHFNRLKAYLRCYALVAGRRGSGQPVAIYVALSGRWGQIYDFVLVVLARLKKHDVVFHHHNFEYIARPSNILRAIVAVAGERQRHIALCPTMALELQRIYGSGLGIEIVSNLMFFDVPETQAHAPRPSLRTIGYISNISFDKGIDRYFDLMGELRRRGSDIAGLVAGPCADQSMRDYVERRMREIGGIAYLGAVYGAQKDSFFSSIDFLVFPSRLNEAQPLVLFEAQAAGVLAAAPEHGCVAQMRGGPASVFLLDTALSNLPALVDQILNWTREPAVFQMAVSRARAEFATLLDARREDAACFRAVFMPYSGDHAG